MQPAGFDRLETESPFLSFVAEEFGRRGTNRRAELAQKVIAHPFVESLGMRVPRRLGLLQRIEDLPGGELPAKFVLKLADGWSARGVMLLECTGPDEYFDHMSLKPLARAAVITTQRAAAESFGLQQPQWIIEEMIEPVLGIGAIPFDYKFYSFRGQVGLIIQIDRNSGPVKIAMFDGEFRPLKRGTDFLLSARARQGVPLIPLHAPEMLWWAQRLSLEADAPFVSIDMFDSPTGPVFGEFTYSPGGTHKRMFTFSHALLDRFDRLMTEPETSGELARTGLEDRQSVAGPAPLHFKAWAGYAYNGGSRGADRLHVFYKRQAEACAPGDPSAAWSRRLSTLWARVRDRLRSTKPGAAKRGLPAMAGRAAEPSAAVELADP